MSTTIDWTYGPIADDDADTFSALGAVLSNAFNFPVNHFETWSEKCGRENFRCVRVEEAGDVAGGLLLVRMGQWFGGRPIPMGGIVAVGIRPEDRSRGAASALMRETVRELHRDGIPLSTLYPATQPVYQRAGYEQAGSIYRVEFDPAHIDVREREYDIVRLDPEKDREHIQRMYNERARRSNGNLDRGEYIWPRVFKPRGDEATGYCATPDGKIESAEGYVFVLSHRIEAPHETHLVITDFIANSPAAGRRLLSFVADHRSMVDRMFWNGSSNDPVLQHLREQCYEIKLKDHWMVRIVDVKRALKARAYPAGLNTELHFDIHGDTALPDENHGKWMLSTPGNGSATVERGTGDGTLRIHINGLASLYTGFRTPWELARAGLLECNDESMMQRAATIFAGPAPWMSDQF